MQAIVDFVHSHIKFDYMRANAMKSAFDVYRKRAGVCRDFAHLAVALCRCMNIPARYCTGYLGDIGIPLDPDPMDYSAWFEAYLGGRWYTFDARHNKPRIGRIVIARGRDAADVAIATTFGWHRLKQHIVWTDEVTEVTIVPQIAAESAGRMASDRGAIGMRSPACRIATPPIIERRQARSAPDEGRARRLKRERAGQAKDFGLVRS